MTWVKLDDQFTENPKVRPLSSDAFRLYVAGLCHCASHLTDGVVERHKVSALLPKVAKRLVTELTDAVLWLEHPDGFEVKDYLKYNPSREQVLREREAAAERKRKYLEKKNGGKNGVPNGEKNGAQNGERSASPPRPAPKGRGTGTVGTGAADGSAPLAAEGSGASVDTKLADETVELGMNQSRALREALRSAS